MRAFTLIETLAVVVLLGIIASVATVSLAGASDQAGLQQTIAAVREADVRARLVARSGAATSLGMPASRDSIVLAASGGDRREFQAGNELRVHMLDSQGEPLQLVHVDTRGRSVDYAVLIQGPSHTATVTFAGLTGWSTIQQGPRP